MLLGKEPALSIDPAASATPPNGPARVYKICTLAAWRQARVEGALAPSADDARDGFMHLSTKEQLRGTLDRHFANVPNLVVLVVDVEGLPVGSLRWEASRGGALFPHLYAALPTSAVVLVHSIDDVESFSLPLEW